MILIGPIRRCKNLKLKKKSNCFLWNSEYATEVSRVLVISNSPSNNTKMAALRIRNMETILQRCILVNL